MEKTIVFGKYADVLTDSGFKAVFGDERNKDILRMLLNEILPDGVRIHAMEFSTIEIPGLTFSNKSIRIDLRCKGNDGTEFIIEMQRYDQDNFFKRCVCYSSRVYDSNLKRLPPDIKHEIGNHRLIEDLEYDLKPVYFIALMAVDFPHKEPEKWKDRFISEYTFREKLTGEVVSETISIIFVELKRFTKRLDECRGNLDEWFYALKNAGTSTEIPASLQQGSVREFFEACEIAKFTKEKRLKFEESIMTELDYYSIINTAERKGFRQGREEMILELAKKMKKEGLPAEQISRITSLSESELESI